MGRSRVHVRRLACAAAALIVGYGAFPVPDAAPGRPVGGVHVDSAPGRLALGSPDPAPLAAARLTPSQPSAAVAAAVPGPSDPAAQAATLDELAQAADHAGDPDLAAAYRHDARRLVPDGAAAAAATAAGAAAAAPAVRPSAAGRAGRRLAGRPGARAGARPGGTRRSRAAAQKSKRRAARQAPPPRRGAGRVLSRVEDWLGGGRHVRRPYP